MAELPSIPDNASPAVPTTHADFCGDEDTVLRSADHVCFNVARRDLERTSGWFRAWFRTRTNDESKEIPLLEGGVTLEAVLKTALGLRLGNELLASHQACEAALTAAEKYEMDGVKQSVLFRLRSALLKAMDPVLDYIVACRHDIPDLRDLQKEAFDQCTKIEIDFTRLSEMSGHHITKLVMARMKRTEKIHSVFDMQRPGSIGPTDRAGGLACGCCRSELDHKARTAWELFVRVMMRRSVYVPSIDNLLLDPEVIPAYERLITTTCGGRRYPFSKIKWQLLKEVEGRDMPGTDTPDVFE